MKTKKKQEPQAPCCIALFNAKGVACASDTDDTIFKLAATKPVGIAVNSLVNISWRPVIDHYLRQSKQEDLINLKDFADDFVAFLNQFYETIAESFPQKGCETLLFGFNDLHLYPSIYCVLLKKGEDGKVEIETVLERDITLDDMAFFMPLGEFDCTAPILAGATEEFMDKAVEDIAFQLEIYRKRLLKAAGGREEEDQIRKFFEETDLKEIAKNIVSEKLIEVFQEIAEGIASFSIEEMVDSSETLINAELRLDHLRKRKQIPIGFTKEIAVMTFPEGFTWLKHSVFAI